MLDRLARKALAMPDSVKEDGTKESADAFAKNSGALRLTIMLKAKLRAGPLAWTGRATAKVKSPATGPDAQAGAEPTAEAPDSRAALKTGKKARVRELMRDVIDRDIEDQPLDEIVYHLCADLTVKPLWSDWISEEVGWKPNLPFHRPLCSPFRTPSRTPILDDLPDPRTLE